MKDLREEDPELINLAQVLLGVVLGLVCTAGLGALLYNAYM